jgi:hypothetical protein
MMRRLLLVLACTLAACSHEPILDGGCASDRDCPAPLVCQTATRACVGFSVTPPAADAAVADAAVADAAVAD